jgi:hypothetical protein
MKKAFVSLALTLALAVPVVYAARSSDDPGTVPFDARVMAPARDVAAVAGLERDGGYRSLVVGAAVPGSVTAQCQVRLLDAKARLLEVAELAVDAGANAQIDFADRIGSRVAAGAQVSCDQPFYAYAAAAGAKDPKLTWGEAFGPNGPCDFTVAAAELEPKVWVANQDGTVHTAKVGKEKGVVCVTVPTDLQVKKMILEWDVNPGPWHSKTPSGNHGMMFLHRGRFRSNTVSNVNAFGPKKSFVKMNQNVTLPAGHNTNQKMSYELKQNTPYHFRYIYDAAAKRVFLELYERDVLVKETSMAGTTKNLVMAVDAKGLSPKGGLFAEFGHHKGQHLPEVTSYGWRYSNLRIEMQVK